MGAATGDGCEHIHRSARIDELDIVRVPACDGYGIPFRMVSRPTWYPVPRGVVSQHGILREYNRLYDVSTNICAATGPTLPHLRRDWAHPSHICAATGPTLPHLRRDSPCVDRSS